MTRKPRIGITVSKATESTDNNYTSAVERAGGEPFLIRPGDPVPPIEQMDGLLISGGVDIEPGHYGEKVDGSEEIDLERDALEFDILKKARDRRIPILGICRGFQLLNVAYGGKLIQDMKGHRSYPVPGEKSNQSVLHPMLISNSESKIARALGGAKQVATNSRHHQAVRETELAPELNATATSPDGYVEVVESKDDHWVVGVQSHPERSYEVDPKFTGLFETFIAEARGEKTGAGENIVRVELNERSYNIIIGDGILKDAGNRIASATRGRKTLIAFDANVRQYVEPLTNSLHAAGFDVFTKMIPSGEESKNVDQLSVLWDEMTSLHLGRDASVIALGGGVIGDLVGFAAASFLRGIDLIQIPTTLLSMVDSSVGGKTGINHPLGKNLLGAFWQPRLVLIDIAVLKSLAEGERVSALAEIIKYGVIDDPALFAWLEKNIEAVRNLERDALIHAIRRSCEIKASVVGADEREGGLREILNFGHTIGHAIENAAAYGTLRHGEAVAIGMVAESLLGLGPNSKWTRAEHDRLTALIAKAGLPARLPDNLKLTAAELLAAARFDKKVRAGAVRYMVPRGLGKVEAVKLDDSEVQAALLSVGAKKE